MWIQKKARNGLSIAHRIEAKLIAQHPSPTRSDTFFLPRPHLLHSMPETFPSSNSELWEFSCPCPHVISYLCDIFKDVLFAWTSLPTYTILSQPSRLRSSIIFAGNFPGSQVRLSTLPILNIQGSYLSINYITLKKLALSAFPLGCHPCKSRDLALHVLVFPVRASVNAYWFE